jgi:VanZ family protein
MGAGEGGTVVVNWKDTILNGSHWLAVWLFWPALIYIVWGELTPSPPGWTDLVWDKALHFTAYFGLAGMATVALGLKRDTLWALLGLAALGGILEILQGFTGRDPDIFDELANCVGIVAGAACATLFLVVLKPRMLVAAKAGD